MCDKEVSTYVYICGHRVKEFLRLKRCPAAVTRNSDCVDIRVREVETGSSRRRVECKQCRDEGYSEAR